MYRMLICQIYVKGNLVPNKIWRIILWGEVRIDALKGGGDTSKREMIRGKC